MLLPAGVPSTFATASNAPGLPIGMSVYDNTGGSPVLVQGPTLMHTFVGNAYQAKFTPQAGKTYLVFIAVYTDNTLTSLAPDYAQQVDTITALDMAFNTPVQSIVGYVDEQEDVEGDVLC